MDYENERVVCGYGGATIFLVGVLSGCFDTTEDDLKLPLFTIEYLIFIPEFESDFSNPLAVEIIFPLTIENPNYDELGLRILFCFISDISGTILYRLCILPTSYDSYYMSLSSKEVIIDQQNSTTVWFSNTFEKKDGDDWWMGVFVLSE